MIRHILYIFCTFLLISGYTVPSYSGDFTAFSGPLPPYSISKGLKLKGISVDTLTVIMGLSGAPIERNKIKLMLWQHAFKMTQKGPRSIMLNVPKTTSNSKLFKWVGPIHTTKYVLIGSKGVSPVAIPAGLNGKKTATVRGSAPEKALISAGVPQNALAQSTSHVVPLRQLASKKVDYFASMEASAAYLMTGLGMKPNQYGIAQTIKEVPMYYAFSKDTEDGLIAKLNENLKKMKEPGPDGKSRYEKIVAKYLPNGGID